MTRIGEGQSPLSRIKHGIHHGHKTAGGKVLDQKAIQLCQHFTRSAGGLDQGSQDATSGGHEQRCSGSFAGNVGQHQPPTAFVHGNEVVPVAAYGAHGNGKPGYGKTRNGGRGFGEQCLLNDAGLPRFTSHLLPLPLFLLKSASVVDRYCHIAAQGLEQPQLAGVEGIQFGVGGGEYSHQLPFYMEGNSNFRERGCFTANVIGVLAHIGRVVHLASGCDVSDHAFPDL